GRAVETPCPIYQTIGVEVDGRYEQLNANILQIENEYYSTVRPKQIPDGMEKPILALRRRGVRYIELRSLDVNAFDPLGIDQPQIRFLEAFLLLCLLLESPAINVFEQKEIDRNEGAAAHRGRDPRLFLQRNGREIRLRDWALEIFDAMLPICELLDADSADQPYQQALSSLRERVIDPNLTPSAQMLAQMREQGEPFFGFAQRMSQQHNDYFRQQRLSAEREALFRQAAATSWQRQREIEAQPQAPFGQYLADYFIQ
ncbi:glutamate--cysteine ligase, partial [Candidatus Endoriftia persephone str. Guaymas]|nr:glutamate--cysteine ligase [Candidatus Endoriftia persephone str. Guaymas]